MPSRRFVWAGVALAAASTAFILIRIAGDAFMRGGETGLSVDPADEEQAALGRQVYAAQCAACHGKALEGQPDWRERKPDGRLPAPPHDADGHTWHHPDEVLFGITKEGLGPFAPAGYQSDMPAFKGVLTDAEIAAVLAFIKSTWPETIRKRQAEVTERAKEE